MSVVQARKKFAELVNRASLLSDRVYVTKHGKRVAALVSVVDAEILEVLEDRLDLAKVNQARADIAKHGTISLEQLAKDHRL
ncbi:MAG: type II toxin-antitoxin system prevent-host-death family antitoxin [Gammaproteobacteria bacterium]